VLRISEGRFGAFGSRNVAYMAMTHIDISAELFRRRLLFVVDSLAGGGAERILCELASGLDPNRYEVRIALTLGNTRERRPSSHVMVVSLLDGQYPACLSNRNLKLTVLELFAAAIGFAAVARRSEMSFSHYRDLARHVRRFRTMICAFGRYVLNWKPDCIVSFLPNSNMISLAAKAWYGFPIPVICSDRNFLSSELPRLPWSKLRRRFIKRFYPTAAAHVAVARDVAFDLHEQFGVPSELIHTIQNGIDVSRLQKLADLEFPLSLDRKAPNLLAVGRLSYQKGFDILLRALNRIREIPWRLTILGEGEEEGALRALAVEQDIVERVTFAGWQPNPYPWLRHSDLLVMSSRWEGMPNILLEAMAIGLPVVAMDCPTGPRLLTEDGRAGRLVESGSELELAIAIAALLEAPEERQRLSKLASERIQQYSSSEMILKYQELIDAVIRDGRCSAMNAA
jgi:glycosyltransferase involved in cell wall biosynthesis